MHSIKDYLRAGFALVPIPAGHKGPMYKGWNLKDNVITHASHPNLQVMTGNVGLAHAYCLPSPTAVLDIDQFEPAKKWLAAKDIDLEPLLAARDAVQILSGRAGRAKLIYRLPPGTSALASVAIDTPGGSTILEFRCASRSGLTVQDVLPPSIHPVTGQPYEWGGEGSWRALPDIPQVLLTVWQHVLVEAAATRIHRQTSQKTIKSVDDTPRQRARVTKMLSCISSDCKFEIYRNMVWALLSLGWHDSAEIAEAWCRTADHRYEQDNFEKLVEDYDSTRSPSVGTIIHHARAGGWNE